jgi:hypothetical protein
MRCFADLNYCGAILKAMRDLTKTIIDQLKKCLGYLNEPYRKDDSSTVDRQSASCNIRHSPNGVFGSEFVRNRVSLCCVLGVKERDGEPPTDYRLLRAIQVNQSIHSAALTHFISIGFRARLAWCLVLLLCATGAASDRRALVAAARVEAFEPHPCRPLPVAAQVPDPLPGPVGMV